MNIIDVPPELLEDILTLCDPNDVAQVAQTNRFFRNLVYFTSDTLLWRQLYLGQELDDPRTCLSQLGNLKKEPVNWKMDLQRFVRARNIIYNPALLRQGELETILETLLGLACWAPPLTSAASLDLSKNIMHLTALLCHGFIDQIEGRTDMTFAERQLIARIHAYYGLTHGDTVKGSRARSRAYVYRMSHYLPENDYGPFTSTGSVDWVHVQALHHVVSMHLVDLTEDEDFQFAIFPMSFPYTQLVIPKEIKSLDEERDWARVEGSWSVSFCFCDHRDLLAFNSMEESDTTMFEDPTFREVFRSLEAKLRITGVEPDPKHPTRPTLHFFGEMESPSSSTMTGKVKMSADNQVQWHFVSGEQGNAIWSSEGVQVGGVGSSYGVLGAWTTIFHDIDDPVGPFWLRKRERDS